MKYEIRKATKPDIDFIIQLCIEHAEYEQANYDPTGKSEKLSNMLFCENPQLHCIIAEIENEIIGYATFSKECSTWNADYYIHLDCLYLKENNRGKGIGEAFVAYIKKYTFETDAHHIEWQTPIFNIRAIKFYNRIGATGKEKIRFTLPLK